MDTNTEFNADLDELNMPAAGADRLADAIEARADTLYALGCDAAGIASALTTMLPPRFVLVVIVDEAAWRADRRRVVILAAVAVATAAL